MAGFPSFPEESHSSFKTQAVTFNAPEYKKAGSYNLYGPAFLYSAKENHHAELQSHFFSGLP
jgi:hypothetical protein